MVERFGTFFVFIGLIEKYNESLRFIRETIGIQKMLFNKKDAEIASECEGVVLT